MITTDILESVRTLEVIALFDSKSFTVKGNKFECADCFFSIYNGGFWPVAIEVITTSKEIYCTYLCSKHLDHMLYEAFAGECDLEEYVYIEEKE